MDYDSGSIEIQWKVIRELTESPGMWKNRVRKHKNKGSCSASTVGSTSPQPQSGKDRAAAPPGHTSPKLSICCFLRAFCLLFVSVFLITGSKSWTGAKQLARSVLMYLLLRKLEKEIWHSSSWQASSASFRASRKEGTLDTGQPNA
jgi:hypothetical protein